MATVTRENIGLLNDKLTVTLATEDYLSSYEQSLKKYAKSSNLSGFRKGMVPAGLIKKMYGQAIFNEEVLRAAEKELNKYLSEEKPEIFGQALPIDIDAHKFDQNNPDGYVFDFEIGLKPNIEVDAENLKVTRYKVQVTDEMINDEINRLQLRNGKMTEPETVENEESVLNVQLTEADAEGNVVEGGISKANSLLLKYFTEEVRNQLQGKKVNDSITIQLKQAFDEKEREWVMSDLGLDAKNEQDQEKFFNLTISKIGLVEKSELNEEFFNSVYPGREIKTEAEFRDAVKAEIESYYDIQSTNQVHDQIYHELLDHTPIELPEKFLKRWLQVGSEKTKTEEEAENDYPTFSNQLKWSLISEKIMEKADIKVEPEEIKQQAKQQILSYMSGQAFDENAPWIEEYVNRMLKDQKFLEDTYMQIQTRKLFEFIASKANETEESISLEDFSNKLHHHHH